MAKQKEPGKPKKGGAAEDKQEQRQEIATARGKEPARLRVRFEQEVKPTLMKEFELKNPMAVPRLHKIVVNMGLGEATQNAKVLDPISNDLAQIVGQKPVITKAKKSIAAFKVL